MGRPPSNGGPSFRFNPAEITEMEAILQAHKTAMPAREVLVALAEKFSNSEERKGKIEVQMKQVWNWFQNRRYAIRAKAGKSPGKLGLPQMTRDDSTMVKGVPQATQPHVASSATVRSLPQVQQHPTVPSAAVRTFPQAPQNTIAFSVQSAGRVADNSQMEYEAKSARDGAWYDVSTFLSHRSFETGDPEVLVRFAGFGAEEDEWVNVRKNVRQRSLPCEASECVAVLPADLILCFQEGKEQALYFDAHVLDAQRRRHDVRGCRCRFLVRYDHDQSEEIVALRKICRRPETDYRLQQLHALNESLGVNHNKNGTNNIHTVSTLRVYPPAEVQPKHLKVEQPVVVLPAEAPPKRQKVESTAPAPPPETTTVLAAQPGDVIVPQNQQNVQVAPSPQVTQDQHKVEPQKVETMVPVPSEEVPPEMHKVQPLMPDPSDEVSDGPRVVGPLVPPSAETSPPLAASEPPHEGKSEVDEPMVCSSSVEVEAELPQVQSASAVETKPEVQAELPEVQPASAIETKPEVEAELPQVQSETAIETKPEVQAALPEVQSASAMETKAKVQTELPEVQHASALEAVETKAEVPAELPQVQPETANEELETKDDVPPELHEVQPACAVEAVDTKAEVPEKLPQVQPASQLEAVEMKSEVQTELPQVQPASAVEAIEMKAEVPQELPQVQHATASALEPIEREAKVPEELPEVQPATASALESIESKTEVPAELPQVQPETASVLESIESKAEVPAELPQVQPESALMETEAEVLTELPEVQPASADMEIEAEEAVVPVCTNDSNVVEDPMEIEAEVEQPKVSEIMDTDDGNDNKVTGDMEQV